MMRVHLKPKSLVIAERLKFHRRTQSEGEIVSHYVAELRKLAEGCDFKNYIEEALRDRLVCGIKNESIQRRLLSKNELDMNKALEIPLSMELVTVQATELQIAKKGQESTQVVHRLQRSPQKPHRHNRSLVIGVGRLDILLRNIFTSKRTVEIVVKEVILHVADKIMARSHFNQQST